MTYLLPKWSELQNLHHMGQSEVGSQTVHLFKLQLLRFSFVISIHEILIPPPTTNWSHSFNFHLRKLVFEVLGMGLNRAF